MSFLSSDNLRLRPVEPSDVDFLLQADSDSEQWILNDMLAPPSRDLVSRYVDCYRMDPFGEGELRLVAEAGGIRVGVVDLYNISPRNLTACIAIYILPAYRRKGLAVRSLTLMEEYAGQVLAIRLLCAKINQANRPSMELFHGVGFEEAGAIPRWIRNSGSPSSLIIMYKEISSSQKLNDSLNK